MKDFLLRNQLSADMVVAAVFLLLWSVGEVGRHPLLPGTLTAEVPWWAALTALSIAIAVCRRAPTIAMILVAAMLVGQLLLPRAVFAEPGQAVYLGTLIVVLGVAASVRRGQIVVSALFATFVGIATPGLLAAYGWTSADRLALFAWALVLCAAAWTTGTLVRVIVAKREGDQELARATQELRAAETETIVAGERERIAQDVHDIMAHSLSVILAQADGARALSAERPEQMERSLETIATSARTSLTEVRMLIEGLVAGPHGTETPALADLDALIERMGTAGLPVVVERYDEPRGLTSTQELAAYRIVQEALTNALKHAGPDASARVVLDARGGGLMISVASIGGSAAQERAEAPRGRGLHGMRERARLAGGWLESGLDDDTPGGYLVTAFFPAAQVVAA